MRRYSPHRYLTLLGITLIIFSLVSLRITPAVEAQGLQATPTSPLPPRPTLTATVSPTFTPTTTSSPTFTPTTTSSPTASSTASPVAPIEEEDEERERPTAVVPGRITGTVIDQRSGAPASGIRVQVGDSIVLSDINGNYDRNGIIPGTYTVALVLNTNQGEAAQGPIEVTVSAGETVVQHLAYFSTLAQTTATSQVTPTTEPTTQVTSATAVATAVPQPTAVPAPTELPAAGSASPFPLTIFVIGFLCLCTGLVLRGLPLR